MRIIAILLMIGLVFGGCSSNTTVIKARPSDNAENSIHNSQNLAADNHVEQGKRLYYKGKYTQATKHFIRALANNKRNWEAHYYYGLTQQKLNHYDRSIGSFTNAIKYCPQSADIVAEITCCLAVSWEEEGFLYKARDKFNEALKLSPDLDFARVGVKRVEAKVLNAESKSKNKKDSKKAF